jgi:hypothetical protein
MVGGRAVGSTAFLPPSKADRPLNFFLSAQAIGADDIDLRFGLVGLAAFNNLREGIVLRHPLGHDEWGW